jgi:hypothetical protein
MMTGANFHALPRYYATGVSESDFVDEHGNQVSVWKAITGRIFSSENENAKIGAVAASDLSNFHKTIDSLAQLVTSQYGLPPHYLGFSTDNPATAEAMRASEARLNLRAERKQGYFDAAWEEVMRLAMRIQTGAWDPELRRLETAWRDPSTPTMAQAYDAGVKAYTAGIVPLRQTRQRLRFSDAQIQQMEEEDAKKAAEDPVGQMSAAIGRMNPAVPLAPAPAGA